MRQYRGMSKERAQDLLNKFPYWSKTELNSEEKTKLWHNYRKLVKGFNRQLSFKTVLEWIIMGELT